MINRPVTSLLGSDVPMAQQQLGYTPTQMMAGSAVPMAQRQLGYTPSPMMNVPVPQIQTPPAMTSLFDQQQPPAPKQNPITGLLSGPGSSARYAELAKALTQNSATPMSFGQRLTGGLLAGSEAAKAQEEAAFKRGLLESKMELETEKVKLEKQKLTSGDSDKFKNEKDLRKEFDQQSKSYLEAFDGFNKVKMSATKKDPSGADDIALIFGFMKTIDPNSTVREGEFATAQNTGSVDQKIMSQYNSVVRGERLTPQQRVAFAKAAETQFQAIMGRQKDLESRYKRLSEQYSLNPENVIEIYTDKFEPLPDFGVPSAGLNFDPVGTPGNPQYVKSADYAQKLPVGTHVIFEDEDGNLVRAIVE